MKPNDNVNAQLHKRLPIDDEEQILAVFRHHWFAYLSIWVVALVLVLAIMGLAALVSMQSADGATVDLATHRTAILTGAGVLSVIVLLFCAIPIWLRMQEQLVLTDEALLQLLQPSLFASKISQLSLQHVADASVRRDFFGTLLGYGKITIETPGEQDNYEFVMISNPEDAVKQIISAHEAFTSALESGRMPTNWRGGVADQSQAPVQLSAEEYQKFLEYQRTASTAPSAPPAADVPSPLPSAPDTTDQQPR